MAYRYVIEAGQDVAAKLDEMKKQAVLPSAHTKGKLDSESLCSFQRRVSAAGFVEAEIVDTMYGYSMRYASGLQNWGLIYSARARQVDGTLEGAIAAAKRWQAMDPTRRYVSRTITE